uniref:Uncharacterized protein n=1 Tax=Vespula pensylvanica TaxID=30213 RepID=A0A834UCL4_VESPE|nr:hypothetical protein H0235_006475 [Vespula pensylvanica]
MREEKEEIFLLYRSTSYEEPGSNVRNRGIETTRCKKQKKKKKKKQQHPRESEEEEKEEEEKKKKKQKAIIRCTDHSTDQAHYHLSWQPRARIGICTFAGNEPSEFIITRNSLFESLVIDILDCRVCQSTDDLTDREKTKTLGKKRREKGHADR